ncbi:MAG TPA: FxLYD domain-containing protein [Verrucomicrobiae bacterium]|nr:FxLYD domain-containing protein [Verrucomicrobiae bacterium]
MELSVEYKCACANCGHVIEYRDSEAGKTVQCPKCGEKSQLPEPEKLGLLEMKGPPVPQFKNCEVCGSQMKFLDFFCPVCEARRKRGILFKRIGIAASAVFLAIAGATAYEKFKPKPVVPPPPPAHMFIATAVPMAPRSTNDLQASHFILEKAHGDSFSTAVGDIKNISQNVHHRIRAEVDLLDKNGVKIGSVSDYFVDLGANQSWHFVANVNDTNAMSVRFAGIKEDE